MEESASNIQKGRVVTKLTQEQIELGLRLGRIFTPRIAREVDRLYRNREVQSAKFAHYTSAEVALKIIQEKRIWMRNTTCMSDYSEVTHGHNMLIQCFNNGTRERLIEALDGCHKGVAQAAIELFDSNWRDTLFNNFVACVSEHDEAKENQCGRLSMWRSFAPAAPRVALVFSIPLLSPATLLLSLVFTPVAYWSAEQMQQELDDMIVNIKREKDLLTSISADIVRVMFFQTLVAMHLAVKHHGFHEEREWRAIFGPYRWPSELMTKQMIIGTAFGVPQRIYRIPLDATLNEDLADLDFARVFDRLIIGPSPYGGAMEDAFIRELKLAGVADANDRVFKSDIPIRA